MGRDIEFNFGPFGTENPDEYEPKLCGGWVRCDCCGLIYQVCSQITSTMEEEQMLPQPVQKGAPGPTAPGRGKQPGLPWVRWDSPFLSGEKKIARILGVKVNTGNTNQQSDVVAKLVVDGVACLFGLRADAKEFAQLVGWFTADETQWVGKEFLINLEEDVFDGRRWPRVHEMEAPTQNPKSGRAGRS